MKDNVFFLLWEAKKQTLNLCTFLLTFFFIYLLKKNSFLFSTSFKICFQPIHRLLQCFWERGELEFWIQRAQLPRVRRLLELPVGLAGVEDQLPLVPEALHELPGHVPDGPLVLLGHRQDDGLLRVVAVQHPHEQPAEVLREDELAQRPAGAPDDELGVALLHGEEAAVHEGGQHVAVGEREVVVRAEDVGGDHGDEARALGVLRGVRAAPHVDHPLGIRIPFITEMRWTTF